MIGKTLGHYQIAEKLGEGGMGVVYKARDTHLDRFVALKVLPPEKVSDPERKRRFIQEAKAASALNHPSIITIYDIDQADGIDFIAMEYVDGKTLDQRIGHRGLRLNDALNCAVQIADALAKAHSAGIVHRDLKPTNIMVNEDGVVKVLDFGLAKLTEQVQGDETASTATVDSEGRPITEEGVIVGTVAYMSPEQALGKDLDARTDLFSLGAVLYEMATGVLPFRGTTSAATFNAILNSAPTAPVRVNPDLPPELERIINKCLEKDRDLRCQSAAVLCADLKRLKRDTDSGRAVVTSQKPAPAAATAAISKVKMPMIAAIVGAIALDVAAIGVGLYKFAAHQESPAPLQAMKVTMLTTTGNVQCGIISPDGKYLGYVTEEAGEQSLRVRQIATASTVQIVPPTGARYGGLTFSSDGNYVYYVRS